jgi:phage shock protein PspC (stress-responsive transcriptional regulator)
MSYSSERLVRVADAWVAGVCGGVARRLQLPPLLVRLAWLTAVLFFGTGLVIYCVFWWLMPDERSVPIEPTVWVADEHGVRHPPLQRTVRDRKLLGVCGGLARRWGVDPTIVRLATLAGVTFSAGAVIAVYVVAALLIPQSTPPYSAAPA